jgi:type IV secretory pathway VirB2 component (pilin)
MGSDNSSSAILTAINWLVAVIQGSVATSVAVIAVASVGLMMLAGRLELKRAVRVIFGCFLLFGASLVAQGLVGAVQAGAAPVQRESAPPPYHPPDAPELKAAPSSNYNPYAGAAFIPPK